MEFFESSDGVRLAYEVEGNGPPLLLHLGAGCDSGLWRAAGYAEPLSQSYTCVLFDHRGHGESDKPRGPEAYLLDRLTQDVVELLDRLGIESVAFWAYSAGMYPGIHLAELNPERVWALVLSGSVGPPDPAADYGWVPRQAAEFREHGWEKMLERYDTQEPNPVPEWMKARIRATDMEQFVDLIQSFPLWDGWDEWEALVPLRTPTLFLTGELEDPDDDVGKLAGLMSDAEALRLDGVGHINAFLASEVVLPRVEEFLAAHAPT